MGTCNFKPEPQPELETSTTLLPIAIYFTLLAISKSNFTFHYVIGRGGFGKVNSQPSTRF